MFQPQNVFNSKPLPERPARSELARKPKASTLAALIRSNTEDGYELVAFALGVFRGDITDSRWSPSDAMQWLADRGFGKSTQEVHIDSTVNVDVLIQAALNANREIDQREGHHVIEPVSIREIDQATLHPTEGEGRDS